MAKFFLRTKKEQGDATLYITIQRRTPRISLRYVSTGILVDIQQWGRVNKSIQAWTKFVATPEGAELQRKMNIVTQTIDNLFQDNLIKSNADKTVIENALWEITHAEAKIAQNKVTTLKRQQAEHDKKRIVPFAMWFLASIQHGTVRLNNGERYRQGTIENWKTFCKLLKEYCPIELTFDDVDKRLADGFLTFLESKGFMSLTINNNMMKFKAICNLAAEEGINNNAVSLKVWKRKTVHRQDKKAEIYLTDEELDALYAMQLSGKEDQARDLFLIGCLTGQRFSDYGNINVDNFRKADNGMDLIALTQQKTGNYVEIPVWDARLTTIAKKWNYHFPKFSNRQLNTDIREVLCKLSDVVPSLKERYVTVLTSTEKRAEQYYIALCEKRQRGERWKDLSEKRAFFRLKKFATEHDGDPLYVRNSKGEVVKEKWELVSTHTARRSSITNLYKSGVLDTREMMSISGHKDSSVFEEYIKVGVSEQAQRVGEKLLKAKEVKMKKAE